MRGAVGVLLRGWKRTEVWRDEVLMAIVRERFVAAMTGVLGTIKDQGIHVPWYNETSGVVDAYLAAGRTLKLYGPATGKFPALGWSQLRPKVNKLVRTECRMEAVGLIIDRMQELGVPEELCGAIRAKLAAPSS